MSPHAHHGKAKRQATCAVLTISDTRTEADDASGAKIRLLLSDAGHRCARYAIVRDEPELIRTLVLEIVADPTIDCLLLTGGTGLAPRDTTFEAVQGLLEKEIVGFGELFRMLSFQEIGSAAMLSRATAGIVAGAVLFSMPGSTAAVELAMTKLVLPELGHVLGLVREAPK